MKFKGLNLARNPKLPRFKKRASAVSEISDDFDISTILTTFLLLRNENSECPLFNRVLRRLVHLTCQAWEDALQEQGSLVESCPCPTLRSRMHPFMQHSRRRGNRTVRQNLAKDFLARGGGYVTTRHELDLKRLGIVSAKSSLASLASSEFVARQLLLSTKLLQDYILQTDMDKVGLKVINLALDESRVCQQQVPSCWNCGCFDSILSLSSLNPF